MLKNKNFPGSIFITGIAFILAFFYLKDDSLFAIVFACAQMVAGLAAVLFILLRLFRMVNSRLSFFYCFTGVFQLALFVVDIWLLFDRRWMLRAVYLFVALNGLLAICILTGMTLTKKTDRIDIP